MKKFYLKLGQYFLKVVLFLVFPLLILAQYDNLDITFTENQNIIRVRDVSQIEKIDALFIGNSYCYSAIQPDILDSYGIKSFNLGVATAGVSFYELILKDYLNSAVDSPETIYILTSLITFSSSSDNFRAFPIHRYINKPISNFELAMKYGSANWLLPLYKKSVKKGFNHVFKTQEGNNKVGVLDRGFMKSEIVCNKEIINETSHLYQHLNQDMFDWDLTTLLFNLTKYIESKEIKVVYFEVPTNELNKYFNSAYKKEYNNFKKLASEKGILFIELDSNAFSEENYRNIDHMNTSGSRIASTLLGEAINQKGLFLNENNGLKE